MGRMRPAVFEVRPFPAHALLDSGGGEKLERFGDVVLRRPDPQALWARARPDEDWARAHLAFERDATSGGKRGRWRPSDDCPPCARDDGAGWTVERESRWGTAACRVRPTPFKHVGLFPEQATNWDWVAGHAAAFDGKPRLLNLFGYTGMASVTALQAGYEVTHVDASKTSLAWARENLMASGLPEDAMRIVLDDATVFARRERRRGTRYQAILVDPPHYGRGPKGEVWQLEEHLAALVEVCGELLAERSLLVLSTYAVGHSALAFENLLVGSAAFEGGARASGELVLPHEGSERLLPCGWCTRWSRRLDGAG